LNEKVSNLEAVLKEKIGNLEIVFGNKVNQVLAGQQRLLELFVAPPTSFNEETDCEFSMDLSEECGVILPMKTTEELKRLNDFVLSKDVDDVATREKIVSIVKIGCVGYRIEDIVLIIPSMFADNAPEEKFETHEDEAGGRSFQPVVCQRDRGRPLVGQNFKSSSTKRASVREGDECDLDVHCPDEC
jgi:hypothetical protein